MDINNHRRKNVKLFIESLSMINCSKIKEFFKEMGVEVTEDTKLIEDDEWDKLREDVC